MLTAAGLIVVLAIAGAVWLSAGSKGKTGPAEARQLVEAGALLVDVRTEGEYGGGHIEGAVNIPVQGLEGRLDELGDRSREIVVYCRSGARSGRARRLLQAAGFTHVHDLGAMSRWR